MNPRIKFELERLKSRRAWKVAVTGHRPDKLFGYDLLNPNYTPIREAIEEALRERLIYLTVLGKPNPLECITGMALGIDQLFGLVALQLKDEGLPVRLFAALPCRNQNSVWKDDTYWQLLMKEADEVFYTAERYSPRCMQQRNEFMVNRADEILAVWNGTPGGTANCVNYARKVGKPVQNLLDNRTRLV